MVSQRRNQRNSNIDIPISQIATKAGPQGNAGRPGTVADSTDTGSKYVEIFITVAASGDNVS
jgi:hypothetical protein